MTTFSQAGRKLRVHFLPDGTDVAVPDGANLFQAAEAAGLSVDSICGGNGTCGKCKVKLLAGLEAPGALDWQHLTVAEIERALRLACQTRARDGQVVQLVSLVQQARVKILQQGLRRDVKLQPAIRTTVVPVPNLRAQNQVSDWETLQSLLPPAWRGLGVDLAILRQLPERLRGGHQELTIVAAGDRLIAVEPGDTRAQTYGIAFDIGTTTLVAYLLDLNTGREVAVAAMLNPQASDGDDLIARLSKSQNDWLGLEKLHRKLVKGLNDLIARACAAGGVSQRQVYEVTAVGNMAMQHYFLKLDTTHLGTTPYAPVTRDALAISAREIGLAVCPLAPVHMLPSIAGFVGSDTVAAMLATVVHLSPELRLVIDVGTNGEIVLGCRDRLIACSAPAGPAFEGARIRQGMRALPGAIDAVTIADDVRCSVIDNAPAAGICGSGLVDAVAQLLDAGIVDATGRILRDEELPATVGERLRRRIVQGKSNRESAFQLLTAAETGTGEPIGLSQQDIRELQLAKGAIRAGAMVLQEVLGVRDDEIREVQLAGAFGSFLNLRSARRIGLVPPVPLDRIRAVGNAAGMGAQLALLSTEERAAALAIARQTEHIQLSGLPSFQRAFMRAMRFPQASPKTEKKNHDEESEESHERNERNERIRARPDGP